jgi:hypothetical protein
MNEPDVIDTEQEQAERKPRRGLLGRAVGWVQRDHLRRGPVPVMGGGFGLITLANYANVPAWPGIPLTIVAAVGMYTRELNLPTRFAHPFRSGIAALTSGGWLTAATYWGPFAGPEGFPGLMGLLGAATAGIAYWAYRKDPAIEQAIAWERAKTDWHMRAPHYGLTGSHLLDWRETRLGERFELDTRGTGRRASELAGPGLEERIAEEEMLPKTRVTTKPARIAGRLVVSIRHKDPWSEPFPHPLLDATPEITLPKIADAREPRIIGMDPEMGTALGVVMWDDEGAKRVIVVAAPGSGKTVLLNNMLERETAADNCFPIGLNVSKAKEMRRWRPALGASACGPHEREKAFYLLNMCRHIIDYRGSLENTDLATVEPSPLSPLVPVYVDEMDELLGHTDRLGYAIREELKYVSTKGRSEGVPWVLVGTRGTADFTGGGTNRNMADYAILGRVNRRSEMAHAAGDFGMVLPEMADYGEGKAGVHLVADLTSKTWQSGRTHLLEKLTDIDRLARDRSATPLEPGLMEYLNEEMGAELVSALLSNEPFAVPAKTSRPLRQAAPAATNPAAHPVPAPSDVEESVERAAASRAKAKANLAATPPVDVTLTSGEMRSLAIARRKKTAAQTFIPPQIRTLILRLVAEPDGASTRQIEAAMRQEFGHERGTSKDSAWRFLDVLRFQGLVEVRGAGGGRRWHLTAPSNAPDVSDEAVQQHADEVAEDDAIDNAADYEE